MFESHIMRLVRTLSPIASFVAGAACTKWLPSDWFMTVLGISLVVALVLGEIGIKHLKSERPEASPFAILFAGVILPYRNGKVIFGPVMWLFVVAAGWVTGMLVCALALPFIG